MKNQIGVLTITPNYPPGIGGSETHLKDLTDYLLKKENFNHYVVTCMPALSSKERSSPFIENRTRITILRFPFIISSIKKNVYFFTAYSSIGLLFESLFLMFFKNSRINILHGHGLAAAGVINALTYIYNKKTILMLHGDGYNFQGRPKLARLGRFLFKNIDKIFVVSESAKINLVNIGILPEKIEVFCYWIDLDKYKPLNNKLCRQHIGLDLNKFTLLFVGRLAKDKGVLKVLEIISLLKDKQDIQFIIIGDGSLRKNVEEAAKIYPNLLFVGHVAKNDIINWYNASNLLLWGSADIDHLGLVSQEAISCGLPVLIPNEINNYELSIRLPGEHCKLSERRKIKLNLEKEGIGFILNTNPETVKEKILELKKNKEVLLEMRQRCREYAKSHFNIDNASIITMAYSSMS